MPENLVERYLTDIGEIRGTRANVPETSFYPALERLLTDLGKTLSPKVRCVIVPLDANYREVSKATYPWVK